MALGPQKGPDSLNSNVLKTGPALIGIVLNWFLFGILVMQYLMYWSHVAKRDKKILQILVHLLFLLDAAQTVMTMVDAFNWFVYNFGNYGAMLHFGVSGIDSPLMDGLIALIVQLVYGWRIWVLSRWRVIPALIIFLAFFGGVNAIAVGIIDTVVGYVPNVKPNLCIPVLFWLWGSVVTDILIAVSMGYLLKFRSRHSAGGAAVVVERLLALTLETNAVTTFVAMATAIMFVVVPLAPPFTNVHLTGGYILGKLYSNCFMVLLNQRVYYDDTPQGRRSAETGTVGTYSADRSLRPGTGNTYGETSLVQFPESSNRFDLKSKTSGDVELGRVKGDL